MGQWQPAWCCVTVAGGSSGSSRCVGRCENRIKNILTEQHCIASSTGALWPAPCLAAHDFWQPPEVRDVAFRTWENSGRGRLLVRRPTEPVIEKLITGNPNIWATGIKFRTSSHMLHVWNIYQHLPYINDPNVGKYTIHGAYGVV